jgi:hypothetical protein
VRIGWLVRAPNCWVGSIGECTIAYRGPPALCQPRISLKLRPIPELSSSCLVMEAPQLNWWSDSRKWYCLKSTTGQRGQMIESVWLIAPTNGLSCPWRAKLSNRFHPPILIRQCVLRLFCLGISHPLPLPNPPLTRKRWQRLVGIHSHSRRTSHRHSRDLRHLQRLLTRIRRDWHMFGFLRHQANFLIYLQQRLISPSPRVRGSLG